MFEPFTIIVNGSKIELLQPIKDVKSLVITHMRGLQIPIQPGHTKAIAEWLYNLTQQVEMVEYNKVLIPKEEVNKPPHMQ